MEGHGERRFLTEGVIVPRPARRVRVFLIHGEGVPPKVAFGGTGVDEATLLHLANERRTDGPYRHVERIQGGLIRLHDRAHQNGDVSQIDGAPTVRTGSGPGETRRGERREIPLATLADTSAWLVRTEAGAAYVLVIPALPDSFDLADALAPHLEGRFSVQPIHAGQMTAAEDYLAADWDLMVAVEGALEPTGPAARR